MPGKRRKARSQLRTNTTSLRPRGDSDPEVCQSMALTADLQAVFGNNVHREPPPNCIAWKPQMNISVVLTRVLQ